MFHHLNAILFQHLPQIVNTALCALILSTITPLVPASLWKTFRKTCHKVVLKMFIKALSQPLIRKLFKTAKFTYSMLTALPSQSKADKKDKNAESENKATEELTAVIDDLLNQLGTKFSAVSEELLGKSMFARHSW
jgi:hypothetical protein